MAVTEVVGTLATDFMPQYGLYMNKRGALWVEEVGRMYVDGTVQLAYGSEAATLATLVVAEHSTETQDGRTEYFVPGVTMAQDILDFYRCVVNYLIMIRRAKSSVAGYLEVSVNHAYTGEHA